MKNNQIPDLSPSFPPGQAEGREGPERDVHGALSWRGGGRALLLAGAQDPAPAAHLARLRLHAATLHRLPARVGRPLLPQGQSWFRGNSQNSPGVRVKNCLGLIPPQ